VRKLRIQYVEGTNSNPVILKSRLRSLKVIGNGTTRKPGTVFYSHSIVTLAISLAISEIFNVKEWPDLKI